MPLSTGVTYQLNPRAPVDQIPVHSMGYGQTAASDGRVFPWTFTFPTTYWSQASAFIKFVGAEEGGMENLAGKTIALIYHNSPYGKEPIPTLQVLAEKYGYTLELLPVDHPGQEQRATWLQIRKIRPDWTFLWGWGVMNQVALKEAAAIAYDMEKLIGVWWSSSESDVVPAGDAAIGYRGGSFHSPGAGFALHDEILQIPLRWRRGGGSREELRRSSLQSRAAQLRLHDRGDPHRPGQVRQPAADRRRGALGSGEPRSDRGAAG